jgi:hypothetical protein
MLRSTHLFLLMDLAQECVALSLDLIRLLVSSNAPKQASADACTHVNPSTQNRCPPSLPPSLLARPPTTCSFCRRNNLSCSATRSNSSSFCRRSCLSCSARRSSSLIRVSSSNLALRASSRNLCDSSLRFADSASAAFFASSSRRRCGCCCCCTCCPSACGRVRGRDSRYVVSGFVYEGSGIVY